MDRDTVDTARNGMERWTAKSQMKALVTKSSTGVMWTSSRQRPKSVLQFESDRVFDQQNSELVSQDAGYKPSNVKGGMAACESTVTGR